MFKGLDFLLYFVTVKIRFFELAGCIADLLHDAENSVFIDEALRVTSRRPDPVVMNC